MQSFVPFRGGTGNVSTMFRLPPLLPSLARLVPFPGRAHDDPAPRLRHLSTRVGGRTISYGLVEGDGPTVLLVHGWALAHGSYGRAAEELGRRGFRVVVPDLPGFGGSTDLALSRISFPAFAAALEGFLGSVLADGSAPVHVVGHSFGGAVAAQLAHDAPRLVASAVLVDSVAGATWSRDTSAERLLAERPLWDWGMHLLAEFPTGSFPGAATAVLRDLSRNLTLHMASMGLVANLIRKSDLRAQLGLAASRGVPVSVVWASGDQVVTRACFDDQCAAAGCTGVVVEGNHGWPLSDPVAFGRVVADLIGRRAALAA